MQNQHFRLFVLRLSPFSLKIYKPQTCLTNELVCFGLWTDPFLDHTLVLWSFFWKLILVPEFLWIISVFLQILIWPSNSYCWWTVCILLYGPYRLRTVACNTFTSYQWRLLMVWLTKFGKFSSHLQSSAAVDYLGLPVTCLFVIKHVVSFFFQDIV